MATDRLIGHATGTASLDADYLRFGTLTLKCQRAGLSPDRKCLRSHLLKRPIGHATGTRTWSFDLSGLAERWTERWRFYTPPARTL